MTMTSLDEHLTHAWAASTAIAALDGRDNHAALMRRVRLRRRRTHAVRGSATAFACLALTGGGIAIANTLRDNGIPPATVPSGSPTTEANPNPGKPVTVLVTRVIPLELEDVPDMPGLDSAVLVHFSADRSRVEVVPLSNYAEVDAAGCGLDPAVTSDEPLSLVQAFNAGAKAADVDAGLRCLMTAVTATTGVEIDGYTVTDFGGFVEGVDALGGIEICVPEALAAPRAHLELDAGWQRLDGSEALGLARTREGIEGDGTYDAHSSREGRVYAALLTAALDSPNGSMSAGGGSDVLNALLDEVRKSDGWTVSAVAAPQVIPRDTAAAPWDSNAHAVFDALAADRTGELAPSGCE